MRSELFDHAMELAVIGVIAEASELDVRRADRLAEQSGLLAEDFHLPANAQLFTAVLGLVRAGRPADLLSVQAAIPAADRSWLVKVLLSVHPSDHVLAGYAKTIADLALRRRLVGVARDLGSEAANLTADTGRTLNQVSRALASLTRRTAGTRTLSDVLVDVAKERADIEAGVNVPIIPTGLGDLDAVIGGLQPTLTILGAHPGVGKSAFIATVIRNLARAGITVGVFSLEDQASWLAWRYLAAESSVSQFILRTRQLTDAQHERFGDAEKTIHGYGGRILIDDRTGLSPGDIVQTARDLILNRGVQALFVDHLGELRYENRRGDRYDLDVAEGLSDLRGLAKSYGVPVICATHLRREALDPPRLFDFANAAAIERQARVAISLTRPQDGEVLTAHVLKQTNGKAGVKVDLPFSGAAALVGNAGAFWEQDT